MSALKCVSATLPGWPTCGQRRKKFKGEALPLLYVREALIDARPLQSLKGRCELAQRQVCNGLRAEF